MVKEGPQIGLRFISRAVYRFDTGIKFPQEFVSDTKTKNSITTFVVTKPGTVFVISYYDDYVYPAPAATNEAALKQTQEMLAEMEEIRNVILLVVPGIKEECVPPIETWMTMFMNMGMDLEIPK